MLSHHLRAILLGVALAGTVYGCAGTYAAEGARQGAVAGAVAGAVGSLFWGGNVVQGAAVGAVTTAAAGAAVGGMNKKPQEGAPASGASTQGAGSNANAEQIVQSDRALEERIGSQNFDAARLLARCQHDSAIEAARKGYQGADSDERRAYSLMIEAIAAEEKGDTATAAAVYPRLVELAPGHAPVEKARNEALSGILKVQQARKAHGLQPLCS